MREKCVWAVVIGMALALLLACASGCATLDRAYKREVTWTNAPVVHVFTNTVVVTNTVPVVTERTNVVFVTNALSGAVSGYEERTPIATNLVLMTITNVVPVFTTNLVQVPLMNLVAKPEAVAVIDATGSIIDTFLPGIGSILALGLGGLYHGYRQLRNRKVNEALIQGVETARALLTTTPQGKAADAQLVKWLMEHQKEAGVFVTVARLVEELTDNPAARMTAQEIAERVQKARQSQAQGA
ncbi:MAG TPA: hypothetical protein VN673_09440 [Clostridia bacterium]|nr:hypothetical protein [Clostridia bacterium]